MNSLLLAFRTIAFIIFMSACSSGDQYLGLQSASDSDRVSVIDVSNPTVSDENQDSETRNQENDFLSENPDLEQTAMPPQMITGSFLVRIVCDQVSVDETRVFDCTAIKDDESKTPVDLSKHQLVWMITDRLGKKLDADQYFLDVTDEVSGKVKIKILVETEVQIGLEVNQNGQSTASLRIEPFEIKSQGSGSPESSPVVTGVSQPDGSSQIQPEESTQEPSTGVFVTSGKSLVFEEDFSGFSFADQKWDPWGQVSFLSTQNSDFSCSIPDGQSQFAGISSRQLFDFSDAFVQLRVGSSSAPEEGMQQAIFGLVFGNGFDAFLYTEAGKLYARKKISGVVTNLASVPMDSYAHGYFGIGHNSDSSLITFYVSTNGSEWHEYTSFFYDGNLNSTKVEIQCGAWKPSPASSSTVDDLKLFK